MIIVSWDLSCSLENTTLNNVKWKPDNNNKIYSKTEEKRVLGSRKKKTTLWMQPEEKERDLLLPEEKSLI